MKLFRDFSSVDAQARNGVVAIGNFDGVHEGHRQVIAAAHGQAAELGAPLIVVTFEPHPRQFFQPDLPPFRLTPLRSKARLMEDLGVDTLFALAFDERIATLEAEAFIEDFLVEALAARHVVVGYDFAFGKGRGGSPEVLQAAGRAKGFGVTCVPAATGADGEELSSTRVRDMLRAGDVRGATAYLGRPWEIEGHVGHGDKRGRQLGFPTANLDLEGYLLPAFGVYAIRFRLADEEADWIDGVANLGLRPTIGDDKVLLEAHLFDFSGDLYGRLSRVALIDYIRPERKFDGLDALTAQIAADTARAKDILTAA